MGLGCAERDRRDDRRDRAALLVGDEIHGPREQLPDATLPGLLDERRDDEGRRGTRSARQQGGDERALGRGIPQPAAERELELGVRGDRAGEVEELALDVGAGARAGGSPHRELFDGVDEIRRRRPPLVDDGLDETDRDGRERRAEHRGDHTGASRDRSGRVGERARQLRGVADGTRRREQLAGHREVDPRGGVECGRRGGERLSGRAAHYLDASAVSAASISARKRSTTALGLLVVGERLADDASGQVDRQRADLAAQRDERGLALGLDLRVGRSRQARSFGRSGVLCLGDDLAAVLTGGIADLAGFLARTGELRGVLLESRFGAPLGLICLRDVALDRGGSLVQQLLEARQRDLPEDEEDDDEAHRRPDDVVPGRDERVRCLVLFGGECDKSAEHPVS